MDASSPPPWTRADRRAVLHNLRYDETLMSLHNASGVGTNADRFLTGSEAQAAALAAGGAVTSISFRTGACARNARCACAHAWLRGC